MQLRECFGRLRGIPVLQAEDEALRTDALNRLTYYRDISVGLAKWWKSQWNK